MSTLPSDILRESYPSPSVPFPPAPSSLQCIRRTCIPCVELRTQAHFWRSCHTRSLEREEILKREKERLVDLTRQQEARLIESAHEMEANKAKLAMLQQQLFGRKTEQSDATPDNACSPDPVPGTLPHSAPTRPRGQQHGAPGHGRQRRNTLPTREIVHDLPLHQQACPHCGRPFRPFPGTEDSEEVHWEVHLVRRVHKRHRYRRACQCPRTPGIIAAPLPPQLIAKSLFSGDFWAMALIEKFLHQRPLSRLKQSLLFQGLAVSTGTLTGGLRKLLPLLDPLYTLILEHNRSAHHWHMDETRWLVFVEMEGKTGSRWWLWVSVTQDTCVYILDPFRSSNVPKTHLGQQARGILSVDRYSAYKAIGLPDLRLAYCWAHVRRDFIRVRDTRPPLHAWAQDWVERINDLYRLNRHRLTVQSHPDAFASATQDVRSALSHMHTLSRTQLADTTLALPAQKVLHSLHVHWDGLTLFVPHPDVPMDNNRAERAIRLPVVGRKNYYGAGSLWSGRLSAACFTLFQTLLIHHLNPHQFLIDYFHACAQNGGRPPAHVNAFLPWNLSDQQKALWRLPGAPP